MARSGKFGIITDTFEANYSRYQIGEGNYEIRKIVFLVSGIYGLLVLLPQYFLETKNGMDFPPPINHPEYYYGFIGVGVAWQILFLILSSDPVRYRLMMIPAMFEKFSFTVAAAILFFQNRIPSMVFGFGMIDFVLGILFILSFIKTEERVIKIN